MGKYLHLFNSRAEQEAYIGGGTYIKPYVGYDRESVRYEKLVIYKFLDILYADANGNKIVDSTVLDPSLGYTPIGLCIAKTGFFGAGEKARFMSLKYMSCETPATGSLTIKQPAWGNYKTDISTIDNIETTHNGGQYDGYLETRFKNIPSLFDANSNWNLDELGEVNQFAVTDIDGKNKTEKLLATATGQSDWRTAATITDNTLTGYAPAACCCSRYHTLGTQTDDWYLGAEGEMSMIAVQLSEINDKLSEIADIYTNDCIGSLSAGYYWSSTEYNANQAYTIALNNGLVTPADKNTGLYVLSILQY